MENDNIKAANLSRELLDAYRDAVGEALVCYILNAENPATLGSLVSGDGPLTPGQQVVVGVLQQILNVRLPQDAEVANHTDLLRAVLMQQDGDGVTVARDLHARSRGADSTTVVEDDLERALLGLAVDAFPAFLLPPNPQFHLPVFISIDATALLIRHPQSRRFQDAVLADGQLSAIFSTVNDASGPSTMVWRNTGVGGGVQLIMLPGVILEGAWRHIKSSSPTVDTFASEALAQLRLVRRLLTGRRHNISATVAFTGILLPDGVERVQLPDGTIEATTVSDRELAPEALKRQLTGTDASGTTTAINYDGDVVLRTGFELRVRATKPPLPGPIDPLPYDMQPPASLERTIERLRLSLLLAVQRESRAQLLPTWRYYDDPFGFGMASTWSDPRSAVGIMPIRLTNEEVESWIEWYQVLSNPRVDHINLAVTRILRAVAERREPTDVLIDAVIAWENIFGSSTGEPTLRVTASLALLLESDGEKRRALRSRLRDIYNLRSGVVHGSKVPARAELPLCQEALDVALRAVRVLARDRADVLDLNTGEERSLNVIMGG